MVIILRLETSTSFRGISQSLSLLSTELDISLEVPSHTTIISYVKKIGIYELSKNKSKGDDWIIILDESIEFGNEKILLILGIREKDIDFTGALSYQDLTALLLKVSVSWTGAEIARELWSLEEELGTIKYAVADRGNALKKGLRVSGIAHVSDMTHQLSWIIKQLYEKDQRYTNFSTQVAHLRGSLPLSKLAYILPPAQRVHSRYMNLKPVIDWGEAIVKRIESGKASEAEQQKLGFVVEYKSFLAEITQIIRISMEIQKMIKNEGLTKKKMKRCLALFANSPVNGHILQFKKQIKSYLEELLTIKSKVKSTYLLCTSDIIESCFGKYKSMINDNAQMGITDLCLSLAAITCNYRDEEEIEKAMVTVRTQDVSEWKNKNIGKTLLERRNEVMKKSGG